ncbi:unnamed protein product [Closterium sp. Yama58-4]|nr:unnamed protein product [Closterium sp. Yama58-4]
MAFYADVYLIGTVMLIFGMGLYDLFIHNFNVEAATSDDGAHRSAHGASHTRKSASSADAPLPTHAQQQQQQHQQQRQHRAKGRARGEGARRSLGSNLFGLFRLQSRPSWLEVSSLDEMKTKLGHVIVMILLVGTFEKSKKVVVATSMDFLCFSLGVCFAAGCLFLLTKLHLHHGQEHGGQGNHGGGQKNSQGQGHGAAAGAAAAGAVEHVNGHINGHVNGQVNGHVYMHAYASPECVMSGGNHMQYHGYMTGYGHANGHAYDHLSEHLNGRANGHQNGQPNGHDVNGVRHISEPHHTGV